MKPEKGKKLKVRGKTNSNSGLPEKDLRPKKVKKK